MVARTRIKHLLQNQWVIGAIIFIVALLVRYVGLKFGFPLFMHPDEGYLINPLRDMSFNHTLDPGTYVYPGFISFYSKFFLLNLLSLSKFSANYGLVYWEDPYYFYFAARLLTSIQGALIPVIAWMIGQKFKKLNFSWFAAFLFIFYPPFVLHSHYVTVDIPLTLFIMLVLLFCLNHLKTGKIIWLILGCLMVAMSAMEKYPGVLAYGIVLVTVGIRAFAKNEQKHQLGWGFFFKTFAWTLVLTFLAMVIIAPPLFLHFGAAWKQIIIEARPTHLGADGLGWGGNLLFYLKDFFTNAGLIVSIFALIGILAAILQKDPTYLLLFFGGGYWIALSVLSLHWTRWSLPMMTTPLFLAALGAAFLWQKTTNKRSGRIVVSVILIMGALLFSLKGLVTSIMLTWPDTRNEAMRYMQENDITQDNSVAEGYTPYLPNNKAFLFDFNLQDPDGKKYLILSSLMGDRYAAEPERYVAENAFYARVRSQLELVKEFKPNPETTSLVAQLQVIFEYLQRQIGHIKPQYLGGPTLEIYKLPGS